MKTYGDFFTGFGGMTIGAKGAGLDVLFGVEYEEKLAAVYRQNLGNHIIVQDVTKLDMTTLPSVDVFHASPPCTNASVANAKGGESPQDIAMSQAVIDYLTLHKPEIFTLENVMGYRHFESWHMIARALLSLGYTYAWQHINMADYGVPQTRRRFIVIARRDGVQPQFPPATHAKEERRDLFGYTPHWVSWYEAIEDLIPTLPDSQFADWQLARLPEELLESMMIKDGDNYAPVVNGRIPSFTQFSTNAARAFIMNAKDSGAQRGDLTRGIDEPQATVGSSAKFNAFIMTGDMARAFVVNGTPNDYGKSVTINDENDPIFTQTATNEKRPMRAYTNGRVVKMTPHAIARFQSFPDWYELPERASLAVKGLGNAVPPLFAEILYRHVVD